MKLNPVRKWKRSCCRCGADIYGGPQIKWCETCTSEIRREQHRDYNRRVRGLKNAGIIHISKSELALELFKILRVV